MALRERPTAGVTAIGWIGWILAVVGLVLAFIALVTAPTLVLLTWAILATSLGVGLIHRPFA